MDKVKAGQLAARLKDKVFAGYKVIDLLNNGKSAAVFKAQGPTGRICALKVFDDDLIERFGSAIQIDRIEREISLKDHGIVGLVGILDGGSTLFNDKNHYYIVMEFIEGMNLFQYYSSETYDASFILRVLDTLYRVSEQLLITFNIAHRDIKPENVMVTADGQIILMDLGVLKIIDRPTITDVAKKEFIGTLRYGPPEFITRHEENSADGWRAINLYQIGGVLHDLLLKKELFDRIEPYGELINAIINQPPVVTGEGFPFNLVQLTRNMLTKDWQSRLRQCTPEKIAKVLPPHGVEADLDQEIEDIFAQADRTIQLSEEVDRRKRNAQEKERIKKIITNKLHQAVGESIVDLRERKLINQIEELPITFPIHRQSRGSIGAMNSLHILYPSDNRPDQSERSIVYQIEGDLKLGYYLPIYLLVRLQNDDQYACSISMVAVTRNQSHTIYDSIPNGYFLYLAEKLGESDPPATSNKVLWLNLLEIFSGTVEFGPSFQQHLTTQIARLLKLCLKTMLPYSEKELSGEHVDKKNFRPILINQWEGS